MNNKDIKSETSSKRGPGRPPKRKRPGLSPKRGVPLSNNTVIGLLLSHNLLAENEILEYKSGKNIVKHGVITKEGISCGCCQVMMSIESFKDHATKELSSVEESTLYVADRKISLMDCLIQAFEKEIGRDNLISNVAIDDGNDEICFLCARGGMLVCCETCPTVAHHTCLGWKEVPTENWCCAYCICKSCGLHTAEDPKLLQCFQCKMSYHLRCLGKMVVDHNSLNFCGNDCKEIHLGLKRLVGKENIIDDRNSWTVLYRKESNSREGSSDSLEEAIYNSHIAIAWRIFDATFRESFDAVKKVDILKNIVFNIRSNIPRLNFEKFHLIMLKNGEEIVSVAAVRFHKNKLVEIPYIATSLKHRNQGLCRILFNAIEYELCGLLNIEIMILQATKKTKDMWIKHYGFSEIDNISENDELKNIQVLMLPKLVKLQKRLTIPNS